MIIKKDPSGKYIYAFEFDFDWGVVKFCQKLKSELGLSVFSFKEKKWRFNDISIFDRIRAQYPGVVIDKSIEVDLKAQELFKANEVERMSRALELKNALETDFVVNNLILPLYSYQKVGVEFLVNNRGRCVIADEMGCISGSAEIKINRGGNCRTYTLEEAFNRFHTSRRKDIPFMTRSLCGDGEFRLNTIKNIIDKGVKEVLLLKAIAGGKTYSVELTPDHEVVTPKASCVRTDSLKVGDQIFVNGKPKNCSRCFQEGEIISYKYSKFFGWCKSCMYKYGKNNRWNGDGRHIDDDGYVRVSGLWKHPNADSHAVVPEHVLVMEAKLNGYSNKTWVEMAREGGLPVGAVLINKKIHAVHHKNGIKTDNRRANLTLLSHQEHGKKHGNKFRSHLPHVLPFEATITSIEKAGVKRVFDIVMDDPNRNFIANGVVVHNCGKTVQALGYIAHEKLNKTIVACPATAKGVWKGEAKKFTKLRSFVVNSTPGITIEDWQNHNIFIINYDILPRFLDFFKMLKINCLIADESHRIKNPSAKRSKAIILLARNIPHFIALSGTPMLNRPIELFTTLNIINPMEWPDYYAYAKRYCGYTQGYWGPEFKGPTNTEELRGKIASYFLRRTKEQVLPYLPKRVYSEIPVELDSETSKDYEDAERGFATDLLSGEKISIVSALEQLNKLRQLASIGKIEAAIDFIKDLIENEKVIVFSCYNEPLRQLREYFKEKSVYLTGETKQEDRERAVMDFQEKENIRLFLGGLKSAGEAITLTAAKTTVFIDLDWVPASMDQAASRNHRPGVKHESLNVMQLFCEGTIDEKMKNIILEKRKTFDELFAKDPKRAQNYMVEALINSFKKELVDKYGPSQLDKLVA